jgi:GNAT superfamily N-acetyltransferase
MTYTIAREVNPSPVDIDELERRLDEYTEELFGLRTRTHIAFFVRDETGEIVGGVNGNYGSFHWLYINALWVRADLRGLGYGSQLIKQIEDEAIEHGCQNAFLNTMSFQAPEFYKKLGYTVFGELEDFPAGHSRIWLRKTFRVSGRRCGTASAAN